ncbi:MAG TPA: UbiD family decarboxylase, partial [Spirochaetia bacterium]|nr:UbiD family decarboxylase [Spirochaetia bacterium]
MAYKDLQAFMAALEKLGLLKRITVPVSTDLEITEIADRVMKDGGPALLFERVKDSPYPLLINTFGSFKRAALALEVERIDDVAGRITSLFDLSSYASLFDKVKAIPKLAPYAFIFPHTVKRAPCQEVIETEPDLDSLPILRCWPG